MDDPIRFLGVGGAGWTMAALACAAKASGVLACAGVLAFAIRRKAAAMRHLVWALGLAGALAILPMAVALPHWGVPVLSAQAPQKVSATRESPAIEPQAIETPRTVAVASTIEPRGEMSQALPIATQSPRPRSGTIAGAWPLLVWLAGTLAVLAWCAIGYATVWRIGRTAEPITDRRWLDAASEAARRLGVTGRVTLLRGKPGAMPVTWGTLRPVILLPAEADEWPDDRRRAVLLHELAHVRRRDGLTQWIGLAACAAYWFNPLAWWASSRLRSEREQACDDLVLEAGERPSDYAAQLLDVARSLRPARVVVPAAMGMARPSGLEGRLLAILDPRRLRRGPARWLVAACLAVVLGASATLAAVRLVAREAPRPAIEGTVLGADGKPVEGADVALLRFRRPSHRISDVAPVPGKLLGRSRSDRQGKFRIECDPEAPRAEDLFKLVATAPNASLTARDLNDLNDPVVEPIRLTPELPMTVRLVDLEGTPIAGADVRLHSAYPMVAGGRGIGFQLLGDAFPAVSGKRTTDADGRVKLQGLGPGQSLHLEARAAGFGNQALRLETKAGVTAVTLTMGRAHVVEGRVTLGSKDGPPAALAKVQARSMSTPQGIGEWTGSADTLTDADGRYRIEAAPGGSIRLEIRSQADGSDGFLLRGGIVVPGDTVSSRLDFVLPRGVLVRGRVADAASGRPIAGAVVWHKAHQRNNPYYIKDAAAWMNGDEQRAITAADGTFQLGVMPGPGYLLVKGPTPDYLHEELSGVELQGGLIWPNARHYPDAFKKIAPKPEESPLEVAFTLRPGATVTGHLVGTDGQPVREAVLFSRWYLAKRNITVNWGQDLMPLRGGRFELGGCDPARSAPVFFLDSKNQRGAMVEISGKQAGQDLEVKLQPCGSASVRLVDANGKPIRPGLGPAHLDVVVTPGPSFAIIGMKRDESPLISDTISAGNLDRERYYQVKTDDEGRMTFPTLIPGATYRISVFNQPVKTEIEFTVKPGEAKDLGDLVISKLENAG